MGHSSRRLGLRTPATSEVTQPSPERPKKDRWWRRTGARVGAAIGAVLLSVFTGIAVKYSDVISAPFVQQAAGEPMYASGDELSADPSSDPVVRMLPTGVTDQDRRLMASSAAGLNDSAALGIAVGVDKIRIIVQAKRSAILLAGFRLVVDQRQKPLLGTLLIATTQGAGKPIQVRFNADDPRASTAIGVDARNLDGQDYFDGNNYALNPGESVEFQTSVTTRSCDCHWHLEVDATLNGKVYTAPVYKADKADFEVTAATPNAHEVYEIPLQPESPGTILGTLGPWVKVRPAEPCPSDPSLKMYCDSATWPQQ